MSNDTAAGFVPAHLVTLDQENRTIVAVIDGAPPRPFDPGADLPDLPAGGGYVVADANCWTVRNDLSQSQYCWETDTDRDAFLAALVARGYRSVVVANKLANTLCARYGYDQPDAVRALYDYVHDQVKDAKGRQDPAAAADAPPLVCGCAHHWTFDSGHAVRDSRGDVSHGMRALAVGAFLRLQNAGGYDSPFAEDVIRICWEALDGPGKDMFSLQKRKPVCTSPNKLMAVAACTHDPQTGLLRTHNGRPWGLAFITRRVIGLNGAMRGTGERAPGNPMRAVLRALGRRNDARLPVDRVARAEMDRYVKVLIRALQQHPEIRPATT